MGAVAGARPAPRSADRITACSGRATGDAGNPCATIRTHNGVTLVSTATTRGVWTT